MSDLHLIGTELDDTLAGAEGNDLLEGLAGNDTLVGNAGDDTLDGGDGTDTADYSSSSSSVMVALALEIATGAASDTDTLVSIENIVGSHFDDLLIADAGDNAIFGQGGADTLVGGAGNDTLHGGFVASAADTADYSAADSAVTVDLAAGFASGTATGTDVLHFIQNVLGSGFNDTLAGNFDSNLLSGGVGNDSLLGQATNDTLIGGTGDDTLDGGTQQDTVDYTTTGAAITANLALGSVTGVTAGTDLVLAVENVLGSEFNDTLTGNVDSNLLSGSAGDDLLDGGEGSDALIGGAGNDTLDGGESVDVADYSSAGAAVIVDLSAGSASGAATGTDVVVAIENVVGSAFDDSLIGDTDANALSGGLGNDTLDGGDGNDTLLGDSGNDSLIGQEGSDSLSGGSDDDSLSGGDGNDNLSGGDGNDLLSSGEGDDWLDGGAGNDTLLGQGGHNTLIGGIGNDTLDAGEGDDWLDSGEGSDTLLGEGGNDTLIGGSGDDTIDGGESDDTLYGQAGNDKLIGGAGFDTLVGGLGDDSLDGSTGNDMLDGQTGMDTLRGGAGDDTYVINDSMGGPTSLTIRNWLGDGQAYFFNLDTGSFTPVAQDRAPAEGLVDWIEISYRDLEFPFGHRFYVDLSTTGLGIPFGPGTYPNAERSSFASSGHPGLDVGGDGRGFNTLTGSFVVAAAEFDYSGSAPVLLTLSVDFELLSGTSAITGSLNYNYAAAGPIVHDSVIENPDEGIDTVLSLFSYTLPGNVENLTLTGSANTIGSGNELDNIITGNSANNTLTGADGNDSLSGGAGEDLLDGGAGSNTLQGGTGNDTYVVDDPVADSVIEDPAAGVDTVMSSVSYALMANVEVLTLMGSGNINGAGNEADNLLNGNTGANVLAGGAGSDRLLGGAGNDVLDGGADLDASEGGLGDDTYIINETVLLTGSTSLTMRSEPGELLGGGQTYSFDLTTGIFIPMLFDRLQDGQIDYVRFMYTEEFPFGGDLVFLEFSTARLGTGLTPGLYPDAERAAFASSGHPGLDVSINSSGFNQVFGSFTVSAIDIDYSGLNPILRYLAVSFEQHGESPAAPALFGTLIYNVAPAGATAVDSVIERVGEGTDTVMSAVTYTLPANVENLVLTGGGNINGAGNELDNVITGNSGANELSGAAGNDTLDGGLGADSLSGGAGNDSYVVDNTGDSVVENAGEGTDTVQSSLTTYTLSANVENLILVGSAVEGLGNALNNVITGNNAANGLYGAAGTDTLIGGLGDDIYIVEATDVVVEQAGEGRDTVYSLNLTTYTLTANVENLTLLGSAGEGLGNALDNVITGNNAANGLYGAAGTDTLIGGLGNDIYVVEGADVVVEQAGGGTDTAYSLNLATYTLTANVENLVLLGSAVEGLGNALDNVITGNNAANGLYGDLGTDTLIGGLGDDLYIVGGSDVVIEQANGGADTVYSLVSYTLTANVENLVLLGSVANATGNELNNAITGNSAGNTLDGSSGNDTLDGGTGADTLTGGNGNDTLVYDAADLRVDGGSGDDTLRFTGAGQTLNLTGIPNSRHTGIEIIDLAGSGNNTLTLNLSDVLDLSNTTNTLRVDGNAGDAVNSGGQGWILNAGGPVTIGSNQYNSYSAGSGTLLVDTDITQSGVS